MLLNCLLVGLGILFLMIILPATWLWLAQALGDSTREKLGLRLRLVGLSSSLMPMFRLSGGLRLKRFSFETLYLDTRCGSVGSSVKDFHAGAFVGNIGGAVVLAVHQYDLAVKSLLAWASRNNSEFVYVGRHACPDLFTETKGELPWQDLTWEHLSNGMTRWSFADTSASTYVHSTCIHFENFTTASVVTRFRDGKPEFWSSTITRQALDFYIIKWVRSYGWETVLPRGRLLWIFRSESSNCSSETS